MIDPWKCLKNISAFLSSKRAKV